MIPDATSPTLSVVGIDVRILLERGSFEVTTDVRSVPCSSSDSATRRNGFCIMLLPTESGCDEPSNYLLWEFGGLGWSNARAEA